VTAVYDSNNKMLLLPPVINTVNNINISKTIYVINIISMP